MEPVSDGPVWAKAFHVWAGAIDLIAQTENPAFARDFRGPKNLEGSP